MMEYFGEAIVILACIGEFFAEFLERPRDKDQRHRFLRLCVIALIGGLAIGLLGLFKTTQISNQEIAGLKTAAALANERSSSNELQVVKLVATNLVFQSNVDALKIELARVNPEDRPITTAMASLDMHLERPKSAFAKNIWRPKRLRVTIIGHWPVTGAGLGSRFPEPTQTFLFECDKWELSDLGNQTLDGKGHFQFVEQPYGPMDQTVKLLESPVRLINEVSLVELEAEGDADFTLAVGKLRLFFNTTEKEFSLHSQVENDMKIVIWQKQAAQSSP